MEIQYQVEQPKRPCLQLIFEAVDVELVDDSNQAIVERLAQARIETRDPLEKSCGLTFVDGTFSCTEKQNRLCELREAFRD